MSDDARQILLDALAMLSALEAHKDKRPELRTAFDHAVERARKAASDWTRDDNFGG